MDANDLFEILIREHADALTVFLRSTVRDPGLADDLFQETMLTAWRTLDRYDRQKPFGPWLRGIASKLLLAARRKSAQGMISCDAETLAYLDQRLSDWNRQPGDTLDEKLTALRACLNALPETYREAMLRRYETASPLEDLAGTLNLSLETLKKRLQRARARLVDCVERKLAIVEAGS